MRYTKRNFIFRFSEEIDIRGEVFIQNSDFKNLKDKFANQNAASGSLRQKNPADTKKVHKFIAYTGFQKGLKVNNQIEYLKKLSE